MLIQYIYLKVVLFTRNLRTRHAMVTIDSPNMEEIYDIINSSEKIFQTLVYLGCLYIHKIEFGVDFIDSSLIVASVVTQNSKCMFLEQNYTTLPSILNFHFF
jgi:hypothetical protein